MVCPFRLTILMELKDSTSNNVDEMETTEGFDESEKSESHERNDGFCSQ